MSGIMDPAFRSDEPGDYLLIDINRDRSFKEMLSDLTGSDGIIMAGISTGKPGWIDSSYRDYVITRVEQIHRFSEDVTKIQKFYPSEKFLKCCEMRYLCEAKLLLDSFRVSNILNEIR
jgi:hypothetical protein